MTVPARYRADVEAVLARRHDLGGDLWTTPDRRLLKGGVFSTLSSPLLLLELGVDRDQPVMRDARDLVLSTWREDGRFRLSPSGAMLPCQTANAARFLCRMGLADDPRVRTTLQHLRDTRYDDGGWRCRKFSYGRGPETEASNPMPCLVALDAFRHTANADDDPALDLAVDLLLGHWTTRAPLGPCHYGIGTRFMQPAYPFHDYNLFYWVHVLSFYQRARADPRFREALEALQATTVDGQVVVRRVVPALATFAFCRKGHPSELATRRYEQILARVG